MKTLNPFNAILALALIISGCQSKPDSTQESEIEENEETYSGQEFDLQGHRGTRGLFPENTIEGFLAAVELQVNTIEMDVVISKDNKVIVSHDSWLNSTICWGLNDKPVPEGKELRIYEMSYDELTNYNCGSQPHPNFPLQVKISTFKPLLSEVIKEVESSVAALEVPSVQYNIEIKSTPEGDSFFHPEPKEFCKLVLEVIEAGNILDRAIIQSFDLRALQTMKKLKPSIPLALLIEESADFEKNLAELGFTPDIYSPSFHLVNEELIKSCHHKSIKLIPWTVNEEEDMVRLLDLGVDGIITDYPDIALTLKL
ncbi:MAG: glycerophosphoryl diester phosphodiesterase [Bacteroidia bacterium]|jgi:glycerophosphoryl diester phosphodiesterase